MDHLAHRYFNPDFRVLRVGCRNELLDRNLRHWLQIVALDSSLCHVYRYNQANRPYSEARLGRLQDWREPVDAIYSWEDAERLDDGELDQVALECSRLLPSGGRLILTAGSRRSFLSRLTRLASWLSWAARGRDREFFQSEAFAPRTTERMLDIFRRHGFALVERVETVSVGPVVVMTRQPNPGLT